MPRPDTHGAASGAAGSSGAAGHWDDVYTSRDPLQVSWYQPDPAISLELIEGLGLDPGDPVLDVGAGTGTLVDALLERGHHDITIFDFSTTALAQTRSRLSQRTTGAGGTPEAVTVVVANLLGWSPPRHFRCWHDQPADAVGDGPAAARLLH